jgi:hypothetical protein
MELPVRTPQEEDQDWGHFEAPETAQVMEREILRTEERTREVIHSPIEGMWTLADFSDEGERHLPSNGIRYGSTNKNTWTIKENDPLSAYNQCEWELTIGRDDWHIRLQTNSEMWSDETKFYLVNTMTAYEGDTKVFNKTWKAEIERDHI